ncbi:hypothetical protein GCM10008924_11820 [Gracilibacillus halotolerans]
MKSIPIYRPVAFSPFKNEETPLFSKITAISGNNIPWLKPDIDTMDTNIQNLLLYRFTLTPTF